MPAIVSCYSAMLFYLGALHLAYSAGASESSRNAREIEASVTADNIGVTETHHASCKVATEEIVANARTSFTRVLVGACKAKTMDERFASLEARLMKEFADIKRLLYGVLEKPRKPPASNDKYGVRDPYDGEYDDGCPLSPRQDEIDRFNDTVQSPPTSNGSESTFVYYWQVEDLDEMLANWWIGRSMRSPTFYAGPSGYAVYLKITPRYFPDGTVFISVGLTRGRYDSILAWPFSQRILLEVMDHSPKNVREDRRSRIWNPTTLCTEKFWGRPALADNPECVGLSIPRRVILSRLPSSLFHRRSRNTRYMWNGSAFIKLIIYL